MLRRKVERLKLTPFTESEVETSGTGVIEHDSIKGGIEQSLWNLMTSNIPT